MLKDKGAGEPSGGPAGIQEGLDLHRAGRLAEAAVVYRALLARDPAHADALHLLGLVSRQAGDLAGAAAQIAQAIERRPDTALYHNSLGCVLLEQGRPEEALAALDRALALDPDYAEAHNNRGNVLASQDRLQEALTAYEHALRIAPEYVEAHYNLAGILGRSGRGDDALAAYDRTLRLRPDLAAAHNNRGNLLRALGRLDEALAAFDEALRHAPDYAEAHGNRGNVLGELGRPQEALSACDRALALEPRLAQVHNNRGNLLRALGRLPEARAAFDQALRLAPNYAEAHCNLGNVLQDLGKAAAALAAYERALQLAPSLAAAHNNRGNLLCRQGRLAEALAAFNDAVAHVPDYAEAHNNLGNTLRDLGRREEAAAALQTAIRLDPDYPEAYNNYGNVLWDQGRLSAALAAFDQALRLRPDFPVVHNNRGSVLMAQGRFADALGAFAEATRLEPDYATAHSNYLFCLNYDPTPDDRALFEAHRAWGARCSPPGEAHATHANARDPDKRLRVGLVSADLRQHPAGYLLETLLGALDPAELELVCYSCSPTEDGLTERLRAHVAQWHAHCFSLSDRELATRIRADGIDILIDLSGHTGGNRLTCFALKPAPVQASWLGYCHTTGVPAVDYMIMDPYYVPPGSERWFTETVVRLPETRWCYAPPSYAPAVAEPPVLANGYVTFGSLNNLSKLHGQVLDVWSRILREAPGSRLLLSWRSFADPDERRRISAAFAERGVAADRVALTAGPGAHAEVLGSYREVDIALDPFPFSGGLTSCEALWMGVPVVTLPMSRPVSRQTLGLLAAIGRTDWAVADTDAYVRLALDLAADHRRLADLRREQRARMAASALCDAPRFARALESLLRDMWRRWCARQR